MTVSVRMDASLENDIEKTAKLRGITKSQFIIEAVERALGRKDPYQLLMKIREKQSMLGVSEAEQIESTRPMSERLQEKLEAEHRHKLVEWQAFQAAKQAKEKMSETLVMPEMTTKAVA
jgi:predicted DNA-binding protein